MDRTSKTESVLEFIQGHDGDVVTASMVADELGLDRKVTGTLLARLASEGRIVKLGRGRYSRSRRVRTRASRPKGSQRKAKDRWDRAFDEISREMEEVLGPSASRISKSIAGMSVRSPRTRVERLVKELRGGLGPRLALDMVQPILEDIFGLNGREMATGLCFPDGGGG